MATDEVTCEFTESASPSADVTDDSCRPQCIDIVPLATNSVTEYDSRNLCFEVKPENLPAIKQERGDCGGLQFIDSLCTTECDSEDWYAEVKEEIMPVVRQGPDDICELQFTEIDPLTRDDDLSSITERDIGVWYAEVKREILPAVKQESDVSQVCHTQILYCLIHKTTAAYC